MQLEVFGITFYAYAYFVIPHYGATLFDDMSFETAIAWSSDVAKL